MQTLSSAKTSGAVLPDTHIMKTNPNFSLYLAFHSGISCDKQFEETNWTESTNRMRSITDARKECGIRSDLRGGISGCRKRGWPLLLAPPAVTDWRWVTTKSEQMSPINRSGTMETDLETEGRSCRWMDASSHPLMSIPLIGMWCWNSMLNSVYLSIGEKWKRKKQVMAAKHSLSFAMLLFILSILRHPSIFRWCSSIVKWLHLSCQATDHTV